MQNSPQKYGTVAILLHWTVATCIVFAVTLGLYMGSLDRGDAKDLILGIHKSVGLTILLLTCGRALWRLTHPAPPLPTTISPLQQRLAHVTHALLYAIAVTMPITGYIAVAARGRGTDFLGVLPVPFLVPLDRILAHNAETIHVYSQFVLYALVAAHVGAALYHQFIARDDVLRRMWPRR
jgi:cytochrome b561